MGNMNCICTMGPGHSYPNREVYIIDHRCPLHGERAQPMVWGRHKELVLSIEVTTYDTLKREDQPQSPSHKFKPADDYPILCGICGLDEGRHLLQGVMA